jgi:hypothetical protein
MFSDDPMSQNTEQRGQDNPDTQKANYSVGGKFVQVI